MRIHTYTCTHTHTHTYIHTHTHTRTHTPVLHASVFARGLLEGDVVPGSEGAKAAGDDGHRAELGPRLVDHIGAGGTLLAVVPVAPLQVVVRAGDGHLHGCRLIAREVPRWEELNV